MANRQLSKDELEIANGFLEEIRNRLQIESKGDREFHFALRRKIYKELTYDERSSPSTRNRVKRAKYKEQNGICPRCNEALPKTYTVLDRRNAIDGYTVENTQLIHQECDRQIQHERGYK